jgi:hypothetical protein
VFCGEKRIYVAGGLAWVDGRFKGVLVAARKEEETNGTIWDWMISKSTVVLWATTLLS